jgi:hypothetical protein
MGEYDLHSFIPACDFRVDDVDRQWIDHPDAAVEWMSNAGFGAYPTQFVGRFAHLMSVGERV